MAVFIVRPRESLAVRSATLITKGFTYSERQVQIEEAKALQEQDPAQEEIRQWLREGETEILFEGIATGNRIVVMSQNGQQLTLKFKSLTSLLESMDTSTIYRNLSPHY